MVRTCYHRCRIAAAGGVRTMPVFEHHGGPPKRVRVRFAAATTVTIHNVYEHDVGTGPRHLHQRSQAAAQPTERDGGTYHGQARHRLRSPRSDGGVQRSSARGRPINRGRQLGVALSTRIRRKDISRGRRKTYVGLPKRHRSELLKYCLMGLSEVRETPHKTQ